MPKPEVSVWIRAKDLASRVVTKFNRNLKAVTKIGKDVARTFLKITGATAAVTALLAKMSREGAQVVSVQGAFNRVFGESTANLEKLRRAARGTVSDFELMKQANQSVALGASDTIDEFAQMIETSQSLGRALGIDMTRALESLNTGTARQSKLMLDNLGLIISLEEANQNYADSIDRDVKSLTDQEKRLAFRNEVMTKAKGLIEELGTGENRTAEAGERFAATIANITNGFRQWIALSPAVSAYLDNVALILREMSGEDLVESAVASSIADIQDPRVIQDRLNDLRKEGREARATIAELKALFMPSPEQSGLRAELEQQLDDIESANRALRARRTELLARPKGGGGAAEEAEFAATFSGASREDFRGLTVAIASARSELEKSEGALSLETTQEGFDKAKIKVEEYRAALEGLLDVAERFGGESGVAAAGLDNLARRTLPRDLVTSGLTDEGSEAFRRRQRNLLESRFQPGGGPQVVDVHQLSGSRGAARFMEDRRDGFDPKDFKAAQDQVEETGRVTIATFGSMAEAVIRGSAQMEVAVVNSFANILRATDFGQGITGTVIGAAAGIVSGIFSKRREPVRVRVTDFDRDAERKLHERKGGPDTVTYVIQTNGLTIEEIEYRLRRRSKRDAISRFPAGGIG